MDEDLKIVCPVPIVWAEVYQALVACWKKDGAVGEPPPRPFVLSGWSYSSDLDKMEQWEKTVHWAEQRGYVEAIRQLSLEQFYRVSTPSTRVDYQWKYYNFEPRPQPSTEELKQAIMSLQQQWEHIAGIELAKETDPLRFTGRKGRRLLILANPNYDPPWGAWDRLDKSSKRHSFTKLRAAVNDAISPHEVDHIDFVFERPQG